MATAGQELAADQHRDDSHGLLLTILIPLAVVATDGLRAYHRALRGTPSLLLLGRAAVAVAMIALLLRCAGTRLRPGQATGRLLLSAASAGLLAAALPWNTREAAVTSAVVLLAVGMVALAVRSRTSSPGGSSFTDWVRRTRHARTAALALILVICTSMTFVGAAEDAEEDRGPPYEVDDPSDGCDAVDVARFQISVDAGRQLDRSLEREGGATGCPAERVFTTHAGVTGIATLDRYDVLVWPGGDLDPGLDGAPRASIWWSAAVDAPGVRDLMDIYRPGDRLECENGAAAPLMDEAGRVMAVVTSDDRHRWILVPPKMLSSYVDLASRVGHLPMATSPLESSASGTEFQYFDVDQRAVPRSGAASVRWSWMEALCRG